MAPPIASAASQTTATIVFGIVATLISIITVWQARRAWRILHQQRDHPTAEFDLESQIELAASVPSIFELPATQSPAVASIPATPILAAAASELNPSLETAILQPATVSAPSIAPATLTMSPA